MHAQMPLLSPFTLELGASALMIGVLLGAYSFANLIGNVMAGPLIDRYSKEMFISGGFMLSGLLLLAHGLVESSMQLFGLRLTYGYVMAFVSPACFALLARAGRTEEEQNKIFVQKGIILTFASIISPAIGGFLAGKWGFAQSFIILGIIMFLTGVIAFLFLPRASSEGLRRKQRKVERVANPTLSHPKEQEGMLQTISTLLKHSGMYPALVAAFAIMYAQGTMMYEIPLLMIEQKLRPEEMGIIFSMMGLGSLLTLTQMWLQRRAPVIRCLSGLFILTIVFYLTAIQYPMSLYVSMTLVGMAFGLLFPAMSAILAANAPEGQYGTAFSLYSATLSLGAIISPVLAGKFDNLSHSFFIGFLVLMFACIACVLFQENDRKPVPTN